MPFAKVGKKHRITKQRKIILEELQKVHSHPTASEVHLLVKKRLPDVGLATVYRALNFFVKNQLALRLHSKSKEARYDGCIEKHCHLICKGCGHVMDLTDVEDIKIKSKQLDKAKFEIFPSYIELFGVCQHCNS